MLEHIDVGLESFFRATTPLSPTDVDVSFEAPDREWSAQLTRPTVNLFLWDIRRSATRSKAGIQMTEDEEGRTVRQMARPVVELRYLVTAWTTELADERSLLSGLTQSLLRFGFVPHDYLPDALDTIPEPRLLMARAGEQHVDVFRALEGQLKPGLNMMVVAEFDVGGGQPVGPPVGGVGVGVGRKDGAAPVVRRKVAGEIAEAEDRGAIGALVRSPADATVVNSAGQFLIRAEAGDEIIIDLDPPFTTVVPASGGVYVE